MSIIAFSLYSLLHTFFELNDARVSLSTCLMSGKFGAMTTNQEGGRESLDPMILGNHQAGLVAKSHSHNHVVLSTVTMIE